jgi:uncharacterized protein (DUF488 family)
LAVFYTVGHSNRPIGTFVALIEQAGIKVIADVRTIPKSRHNPQFNSAALEVALREAGIGYTPMPGLGGLRGRQKGAGASPNGFWENAGFRNFADYASTPQFARAFEELRAVGQSRVCAVMCAEAVWWRCHRRIIADYLMTSGEKVIHIMGEGHFQEALITAGAAEGAGGTLIYPPSQPCLL